jgi:hypothetical protein
MLPKSKGILNSIGLIYESVSIYILHCDRLHIRCDPLHIRLRIFSMVWGTAYKTLKLATWTKADPRQNILVCDQKLDATWCIAFFIYSYNIMHQISMLSLTPLGCHMDKGRPKTKQSCLRPEAWWKCEHLHITLWSTTYKVWPTTYKT